MRDCGLLIIFQFFFQNKTIKAWQKEMISNAKEADRKEAEEDERRVQYWKQVKIENT